jgi:hypothetical protein
LKKQLLTTTALAAAGAFAISGAAYAQASKPTLSLGGWGEGIVAISDQDNRGSGTGTVGVDVHHDSEIHFKGATTLDNGIKLATRVELEGNTSADTIDEAYVTVTGSFGQFRIGSDDNAAHLEVTSYAGTWATQVGQNAALDSADMATRPSGFSAQTNIRLDVGDGDAEKITYFTPRIGGFRAGFSYLPSSEEDANGSMSQRSTERHEGFAGTASFEHKFGAVGLGLAAGYLEWTGRGPSDAATADPRGWNVGGRVDVGAFRLAAGFMSTREDGTNANVTELGARYKMGKNNFSVGYIHGEHDGTTAAGEDETDILLVSYRRDLGPGVQYRLNLWWVDYTGEDAGNADDNEALALSTSVRVAF